MTLRRRALLGVTAGVALPGLARASRRNAIELLVGASPGSAPDLWTRSVAPFLERAWPRLAVAVRNAPGRGGLEAVAELAAASAERKVVGVLSTPLLLARAIEAGEPSPASRVAPLAALLEEPILLVAGVHGPESLAALRALGDRATLGTPPPGSAAHVAALRLDRRLALPRLAFPSSAAARQAALSGNVAAAVLALPDAIVGLREERLVGLGIASAQRTPLLPEVATLREQGVDLVATAQRGFALPPAAPESWRAALLSGLEQVANDPDFAAECAGRGQLPRFLGPEAWGRVLARVDAELRSRWQEEPWLPRRA